MLHHALHIMSRQGYTYAATVAAPRQMASHGTSSAFSSSANPDEDWTQISDLAERRRIQNRIAQRNYRKKLKRRLEDLERRAGSSSASPPEVHAQLKPPAKKPQPISSYQSPPVLSSSNTARPKVVAPRGMSHSQYTPPMHHDDDNLFSTFEREGSHTPPLFTYHGYPTPEESLYPHFSTMPSYRLANPLPPTTESYPDYLTPAPMTLPSMLHFNEALKRDSMTGQDDSLNPFSMSYAAMAGIDIQPPQTYGDSHPHTPPLSHSFEHSASCSEAGYTQYPTTPLSMSPSPRPLQCL